MPTDLTRRRFLTSGVAVAALAGLPHGFTVVPAIAAFDKVRMTTGNRGIHQSISWLGAEAGNFRKYDLDVSYPAMEVGGLRLATGLTRGEWDFYDGGLVPLVENVVNGGDAVALLRHTLPHSNTFIVAKREVTALDQLAGKRMGVLSDAYTGQAGVQARLTLEKVGATATYVGLGTYENIYKALVNGEIDAGTLPVHLRLSGEREHGWNAFQMSGFEADVPSVLATTRKLIASNRDLVMRVVKGHVESIHAFKTRPDVFIPLLQRFAKIDDRRLAADMHKYYAPLFPQVPRMTSSGFEAARSALSRKYPAAQKLQESDVVDSSFIDELESSGFIRNLYAGAARP